MNVALLYIYIYIYGIYIYGIYIQDIYIWALYNCLLTCFQIHGACAAAFIEGQNLVLRDTIQECNKVMKESLQNIQKFEDNATTSEVRFHRNFSLREREMRTGTGCLPFTFPFTLFCTNLKWFKFQVEKETRDDAVSLLKSVMNFIRNEDDIQVRRVDEK